MNMSHTYVSFMKHIYVCDNHIHMWHLFVHTNTQPISNMYMSAHAKLKFG